MQSNQDKLNAVWGQPVKSVHSLQDLAKLVQAAPQQPTVQTELALEKPRQRGHAITKPEIHEAAKYALAHPEETYSQVAAKFNVNPGSLYSRVFRLKNNGRYKPGSEKKPKRKNPASREELAARLVKAREAKAAKKALLEAQKNWSQPQLSTSEKSVKQEHTTNDLTIDYITRMNFSYSIGRAVEYISQGRLVMAMEYLTREVKNRGSK